MTNLILRGTRYYLRKQVNGKTISVSLKTSDKDEAERKAAELLLPYSLANKADAQRLVLHQLAGTQGELAIAREKVAEKIAIADAWQAFSADPSGPQCDKRQWDLHLVRWNRFEAFMLNRYPTVANLEDVTWEPHGREFCSPDAWQNADQFNRTVATVKMVFSVLAGRLGNIPNPMAPAKARHHEAVPRRCLTEDELRRVFAAVADDPQDKVLFGIGLYTGLRLSDCATIRFSNIDADSRLLTVQPQKTRRYRKSVTLALPESLYEAVKSLTPDEPQASAFVLPAWAGMTPCQRNEAIMTVFRRCGILTQEKRESGRAACVVGFHSLRHTFITMSLQRGTPQSVVQAICGHSSTKTQAGYFHANHEDAKKAVEVLPLLLQSNPTTAKLEELRERVLRRAKNADLETLAVMFCCAPKVEGLWKHEFGAPAQSSAPTGS